jgi:hypothetical protein
MERGMVCLYLPIKIMMPPIEFQQRLLERANAEKAAKLRYRGVSYVSTKPSAVKDPEYFGKKI